MRHLLLAAGLLTGLTGHAADLSSCTAIAADAERLACYDQLAGRTTAPPPVTAERSAPLPAASFGAEQLPNPAAETAGPQEIQAHLEGGIDHWKKGMEFRLDNGQVWRCIDDRRADFAALDRPAVTLRRNFIGSYFMRIDGVYLSPRVRRVR